MENICTSCKKSKPETDFFIRNVAKDIRHSQCKICYTEKRKLTYKKHYHKYGDMYRQRAIKRKLVVKSDLRLKMLEFLDGKNCVICGMGDIRVLEFDHINPSNKSFSIARGLSNLYKWDNIIEEIKKCRILCANCHKIVTAEQQNWYKVPKI